MKKSVLVSSIAVLHSSFHLGRGDWCLRLECYHKRLSIWVLSGKRDECLVPSYRAAVQLAGMCEHC